MIGALARPSARFTPAMAASRARGALRRLAARGRRRARGGGPMNLLRDLPDAGGAGEIVEVLAGRPRGCASSASSRTARRARRASGTTRTRRNSSCCSPARHGCASRTKLTRGPSAPAIGSRSPRIAGTASTGPTRRTDRMAGGVLQRRRMMATQLPGPGEVFLDHMAHFVPAMEPAAAVLERCGFRLTPFTVQTNREGGVTVPSGTGNRCAMLRNGYLELLAATSDTPLAQQLRERHRRPCRTAPRRVRHRRCRRRASPARRAPGSRPCRSSTCAAR